MTDYNKCKKCQNAGKVEIAIRGNDFYAKDNDVDFWTLDVCLYCFTEAISKLVDSQMEEEEDDE